MPEETAVVKKKWFHSWTIWTAGLSFVAVILADQFGIVLSPETQAGVMSVLMIVLRIKTDKPI